MIYSAEYLSDFIHNSLKSYFCNKLDEQKEENIVENLKLINPILLSPPLISKDKSLDQDDENYGLIITFPSITINNEYQFMDESFEDSKWIIIKDLSKEDNFRVERTLFQKYENEAFYYLEFDELPIYVQAIILSLSELYNSGFYTIHDNLPYNLFIEMYPNFDFKIRRKEMIETISTNLNLIENTAKHTNQLIDSNMDLEDVVNALCDEYQANTLQNFTYCLDCGNRIEVGRYFCKPPKKKPKNCNNKFNYKLKRIGIRKNDRRIYWNKYYNEIQKIMDLHKFTAHKIFTQKHPELFDNNQYLNAWKNRKKRIK